MKAGIETLEEVEAAYGDGVAGPVGRLEALWSKGSLNPAPLGALVDIVVDAVEDVLHTLGIDTERKEGF
jgi:hypothetical protein